jgi:DNA-binding XRE family transcriptional regulator
MGRVLCKTNLCLSMLQYDKEVIIVYVYAIGQIDGCGPVKFGCSKDPIKRLRTLQGGHPQKLILLAAKDVEDGYLTEKAIHFDLWNLRINYEWFDIDHDRAIRVIENLQGDCLDVYLTEEKTPSHQGWIQHTRNKFRLTADNLGKKLGVTRQAVGALEKSERDGGIRLSSLQKAAEALNCEFVYYFTPKDS